MGGWLAHPGREEVAPWPGVQPRRGHELLPLRGFLPELTAALRWARGAGVRSRASICPSGPAPATGERFRGGSGTGRRLTWAPQGAAEAAIAWARRERSSREKAARATPQTPRPRGARGLQPEGTRTCRRAWDRLVEAHERPPRPPSRSRGRPTANGWAMRADEGPSTPGQPRRAVRCRDCVTPPLVGSRHQGGSPGRRLPHASLLGQGGLGPAPARNRRRPRRPGQVLLQYWTPARVPLRHPRPG